MPTVIDSLIVKLGIDNKGMSSKAASSTQSLKEVETQADKTEQSFEGLTKTLAGFLALIGGTVALKHFVSDTIDANAALDRFSKNIGLSTETVSAWSNAVEETGGSAKNLQGTMDMLSKAQTELLFTGQSTLVPYFAKLGVALSEVNGAARPVDDILLDLSDRFSHMNRTQANNLGRMMGIDQDTLNLLLRGRKEVELTIARQKEYNAVSRRQAEDATKLQRGIVSLRQEFEAFGRDLLQEATPSLMKVLQVLQDFGNFVKDNLNFFKDLAIVLGGVGVALAAIAVLSSPITVTVAALTALATAVALVWDDFQVWKKGGDSFLPWGKWKAEIQPAIDLIHELEDSIKSLGETLQSWDQSLEKKAPQAYNKVGKLLFGRSWRPDAAQQKADAAAAAPDTMNAQEMKRYFVSQGWTDAQASGIAANLFGESSGYSKATGDHGTAYGLAQWHKDRQANFKAWSGKDIRDASITEQLAFVNHELTNGTEKDAGDALRKATTAQQAGAIVSRQYERPADVEGNALARGNFAAGLTGIKGAAAPLSAASSPAAAGASNSNVETHIGEVRILTNATDANGIARAMQDALNYHFTTQANNGAF